MPSHNHLSPSEVKKKKKKMRDTAFEFWVVFSTREGRVGSPCSHICSQKQVQSRIYRGPQKVLASWDSPMQRRDLCRGSRKKTSEESPGASPQALKLLPVTTVSTATRVGTFILQIYIRFYRTFPDSVTSGYFLSSFLKYKWLFTLHFIT